MRSCVGGSVVLLVADARMLGAAQGKYEHLVRYESQRRHERGEDFET